MNKIIILLAGVSILMFSGCKQDSVGVIGGADGPTSVYVTDGENGFVSISQEQAKDIMDNEENYVILDVREQDEFDKGHIPNAILIPHGEIKEQAAEKLPDKEQKILVYCRSGRRSKIAAKELAKLGYKNVQEFGGINEWEYDIEK